MTAVPNTDESAATFHAMTESTAEDWAIIAGHAMAHSAGLADRVLDHLRLLR
ncbi:MAG: phosphohydrolase, partial [Acidimicrobiia bacterium]|nr:phosphohydrolase [Acidimicrobiia bacterium]